MLALVNAERAAAGCGALSADSGLASVARAHSADMRDRGFFDHVNLDGLDPFDRADRAGIGARAENIAYGQPDAAAVMDAWMNSSGHRANILNCSLTSPGCRRGRGRRRPLVDPALRLTLSPERDQPAARLTKLLRAPLHHVVISERGPA